MKSLIILLAAAASVVLCAIGLAHFLHGQSWSALLLGVSASACAATAVLVHQTRT